VKLDPSAFVADPDLILTLEKGSEPISCDGDCVLFRQGEIPAGLYILNQGELAEKLQKSSGNLTMVLANLAMEMGAKVAFTPVDEILLDYLRPRVPEKLR